MSGIQKPNRKTGISPRLLLVFSCLILISLACNMPLMAKQAGPDQPAGFVETSIAETLIAREGGAAADSNDQGADQAPTATDTPEVTDTPTLTPTITDTPTPEVAMIYSSANTNCRTGPATSFAALYTMQEGEQAEAVAKGPQGQYWYIKHPNQPSTICALWGKYATPSGPYEALPVWTPMPTPTPQGIDFSVAYHSYIACGGVWGLQYRIDNIGSKTLESWQTSVKDHTGGSNPQVWTLDDFAEYSGACVFINKQDDLTPGEAFYLVAVFFGDPKGHSVTTTIKICAQEGLAGKCLTKSIKHKP